MYDSGGPGRRGRRVVGALLGLSYLFASATGAAGTVGCIHSPHADREPAEPVAHESASRAPQHHTQHVTPPSASGGTAIPGTATTPLHHDSSDTCDCLGDCSTATGVAEVAIDGPIWVATRQTSEALLPSHGDPESVSEQHRLPDANAPPLF